jgi:hypothetical protein
MAYRRPASVFEGLQRAIPGLGAPAAAVISASLHRYLFGETPSGERIDVVR